MGGKDEEMPARGLPCMPHYGCYITYNFSRSMYTCSGATEFFSISLSFITKTIDGMEQTKHTCKYVFILLHLNHCHNSVETNNYFGTNRISNIIRLMKIERIEYYLLIKKIFEYYSNTLKYSNIRIYSNKFAQNCKFFGSLNFSKPENMF